MKIATLFSGIGSPEQAAKRVFKNHTIIFACEFDKYARQSYKANYNIDNKHFHKDIYDMDGTPYKGNVDILIGGSPCQDFSVAGLRAGIKGNKGILIYEYLRIIKETQPKILIYENVKGMLSDQHGRTLKEFIQALSELGYHCHYDVLNTKDFGVPQNRERIFVVGFKDVEHYHNFNFAPKMKLDKTIKDILETDIDEKYFLSDKMLNYITTKAHLHQSANQLQSTDVCRCLTATDYKSPPCVETEPKMITCDNKLQEIPNTPDIGQAKRIYRNDGIAPAINTCWTPNTNHEPKIEQIGTLDIKGYDCIKRVYGTHGISPTITAMGHEPKICDQRIRKLTPRECLRLQDFKDDFKIVVSNSQAYKQAGNSISVNVMEMILRQIEKARDGNTDETSLFYSKS